VPVPSLVLVPPVRVRVRVPPELARAAGWMLEKTLIRATSLDVNRTVATLFPVAQVTGNALSKSWQSPQLSAG
jgi:hypothetical protein